jgi:serine phosphatase RsbU (regulator of sigma subunit)
VDSDPEHVFENHVLHLRPEMRFYLFTDGFPDQLGGPRRLPFGKKRFKQLILENREQPFAVQRDKLLIAFEQHRGDKERQDDITVVGFALEREK